MRRPRNKSSPIKGSLPALTVATLLFVIQPSSSVSLRHPPTDSDHKEVPELVKLRGDGNALFRRGEYMRAIEAYQRGYAEAKHFGDLRSAVRFLNNLGSAQYRMFHYRDAMHAYLEARDVASRQRDRETLGALDVNLSSLYLEMGDIDAAEETVEQGLKLPNLTTAKYRVKLLIQSARIREEKKDLEQAEALLKEAAEASRAELDFSSEAQAWNELGSVFLGRGQLQSAEEALLEGFRLRKLTDDNRIYFSYETLGNLRLKQGDLESAVVLFNRAIDTAGASSPLGVWNAYYDRGRVRLAQGQLRDAFDDFRTSLNFARRWRVEVPPADAFRIGADVELHDVYSSFIELGRLLFEQSREERFAEQTFAAAEENRAESLRALWTGPDLTKRLPDVYWQTLADLREQETFLIRDPTTADRAPIRQLHLTLAERETRAELDFPVDFQNSDRYGADLMDRVKKVLRPTEAFIGFHVGDERSCVWAISRHGFDFKSLPRRLQLTEDVRAFVAAIRAKTPDVHQIGGRLYAELFDGIKRSVVDRPHWIVAPDGPLFELPFAALREPESDGAQGSYLIERHAIQIVPGVSVLFNKPKSRLNELIVGLGDPIYNRADQRLHKESAFDGEHRNAIVGPVASLPQLEFPRLVGSGRELTSCASIWRDQGFESILLVGAAANRSNLMSVLRRDPTAVHVAAHFVFPKQGEEPGLLGLTPEPGKNVDLLSATEISKLRINVGLVVLNACSSGRAPALPGAGLMGMTRSWMAAGAHAVIATRWSTSDQDEGQLFQSFYHLLSSTPRSMESFAELLQQAQLIELRVGGSRANPAYWAAYFCVERN
jgi:CHAT domain-containing protein/tetratricopeptide (TPR) repeat protein